MERLIVTVVIAIGAIAIAAIAQRRRPDTPTGGSGHVPMQVDRADFAEPTRPWALLVFTSATCQSCAEVLKQAHRVDHDDLVVTALDVETNADLHERYRVDAVPLSLLVDANGVTRKWFLGPTAPGDIADAVAQTLS